jgi:uncharacterized membrane protein
MLGIRIWPSAAMNKEEWRQLLTKPKQDSYGVVKPVIIIVIVIVIVIVTARLITRAASLLLHALLVTCMSAQVHFSIQFVSKLSTVY